MEQLQQFIPHILTGLAILAGLIILMLIIRSVGGRTRGRSGARLSVSEIQEIDKSRHLVLIRRDDVEHLLLVGGNHDVVIETGIEGAETRKSAEPPFFKRPRRRDPAPVEDVDEPNLHEPPRAPVAPRPMAPRHPQDNRDDYDYGPQQPALRPVD